MATFPSFNAKDREERKIALAIFLAYCTIKEWYYLIRQQEKVPEVNQNEGELYSFGITTYPQRLSHFFFFIKQVIWLLIEKDQWTEAIS